MGMLVSKTITKSSFLEVSRSHLSVCVKVPESRYHKLGLGGLGVHQTGTMASQPSFKLVNEPVWVPEKFRLFMYFRDRLYVCSTIIHLRTAEESDFSCFKHAAQSETQPPKPTC